MILGRDAMQNSLSALGRLKSLHATIIGDAELCHFTAEGIISRDAEFTDLHRRESPELDDSSAHDRCLASFTGRHGHVDCRPIDAMSFPIFTP